MTNAYIIYKDLAVQRGERPVSAGLSKTTDSLFVLTCSQQCCIK